MTTTKPKLRSLAACLDERLEDGGGDITLVGEDKRPLVFDRHT